MTDQEVVTAVERELNLGDASSVIANLALPTEGARQSSTFGLGVNWWDVPYKGMIDELRVYDTALTAAEIAALAQPAP
jgi:arabinan endo-1,5-alpha-L-arabinosidase